MNMKSNKSQDLQSGVRRHRTGDVWLPSECQQPQDPRRAYVLVGVLRQEKIYMSVQPVRQDFPLTQPFILFGFQLIG